MVFWGPISSTIHNTQHEYFGRATPAPRVLMYRGAVNIADQQLPLGAGFGRWGSAEAMTHYSPEYIARGFNTMYGLAPHSPINYATDTFWPIVIGEAGWLGLAFYVVALWKMYAAFRRGAKDDRPGVRAVGAIGVGWLVMLLFESFAAPVFTGPPLYAWLFVAAGLLVAVSERVDDTPEPKAGTPTQGMQQPYLLLAPGANKSPLARP